MFTINKHGVIVEHNKKIKSKRQFTKSMPRYPNLLTDQELRA